MIWEHHLRTLAFEQSFFAWLQDQGYDQRELRYERSGGSVCAWEFSPPGPRARVLFVHSAGNDAFYPHIGQFKALLKAGFTVATFDIDGHGRRSSATLNPDTILHAIADARRHIWPVIRGGSELPVMLVGYSLGGALVWRELERHGDLWRAAVILASPLELQYRVGMFVSEAQSLTKWSLFRSIPSYGTHIVPAFGTFRRHLYPVRLSPEALALGQDHFHRLSRLFDLLELRKAAAHVTQPVLLLYGDRDMIAPVQHGHESTNLCGTARMIELKRETHLTTPMAAAGIQFMVRFFEEQLRSSGISL